MKVKLSVQIRPQILDPQGEAVLHTLRQLGHDQLTSVRIGKLIELDIDETDKEKAHKMAVSMAKSISDNSNRFT